MRFTFSFDIKDMSKLSRLMAFSEIMLTEAPVSTNIFTGTLSTEIVTKRHDRIEFILKLGHFNPSLLKCFQHALMRLDFRLQDQPLIVFLDGHIRSRSIKSWFECDSGSCIKCMFMNWGQALRGSLFELLI